MRATPAFLALALTMIHVARKSAPGCRDDSGRREKEPFERPFSLSTHFTAPRAGAVAAADEQSAAEQRRTDQLMHVIEKLSR